MNQPVGPGQMGANGMVMVRQQMPRPMNPGMGMAHVPQQMHQQPMNPMHQQQMQPQQMAPMQPQMQHAVGMGHLIGPPFPMGHPGQFAPRLQQQPQPMPPRSRQSNSKRKVAAVTSPSDPNVPRAKNPKWTPPVPDAVDARSPLVVDVVTPCVIHVTQMCLCPPTYPGGRMCRCNPNNPIPVLRIAATQQLFDLMDHKWAIEINELLPVSSTDPSLQISLTISPVNPLPSDAYIKFSASMCMINRSVPSRQRHEFKLGSIAFGSHSFYNLPVDKQFLTAVAEQPLSSLPINSSLQIDIELSLEVLEFRNIRNSMRFSYDFRKQSDLSDLVLKCSEDEFFVDCSYLRYYSEYFEITRGEMEMGRMKTHPCRLPLVDLGEDVPGAVMEDILLFISPCRKNLSTNLLLDIARVADRLMLITVKEEAERQLMRRTNNVNDLDVLQAAFDFNMDVLKDHMLNRVMNNRTGNPAMDLMLSLNNPEYQHLSAEVKAALLDRCVTVTGTVLPCNSNCFGSAQNPLSQR